MSQRLIDAAARNVPELGCQPAVPPVALAREAVALLGWGTMTYGCEKCGFEWRIWLALGVEGPPALREAALYVPSSFSAGRCPAWPIKAEATAEERAQLRHMTPCDGEMLHVRFGEDEEFTPRLIPDDVPRWVLDSWHDQAALVIPQPALVAARRFHADREVAADA